jgi:hypothetical protein
MGLITLVLAGVGVFVAFTISQQQSPKSTFATNNCCNTGGQGGGACTTPAEYDAGWYNCQRGGCDACRNQGGTCGDGKCGTGESHNSCSQDCNVDGSDKGSNGNGNGNGTGTPAKCSNTSGACNAAAIGKVVPISGGTCTCQVTGANNLCGCVVAQGSSCGNKPQNAAECNNQALGSICDSGTNSVCKYKADASASGAWKCACEPAGTSLPVGTTCSNTATSSSCTGGKFCNKNSAGTICMSKLGTGQPVPSDISAAVACLSGFATNGVCSASNGGSTSCANASCSPGYYCDNTGTLTPPPNENVCKPKKVFFETCAVNRECVSGICGVITGFTGNRCKAIGGGTECSVTGQLCADSNKFCSSGFCVTRKNSGTGCTTNNECKAGLLCISGSCNTPPSNPGSVDYNGTSCSGAGVYCKPGSNPGGEGRMCSGGTLGAPTKYDACAPQYTDGMTCGANTPQFSTGEANKGKFIGCSGTKNCFCGNPSDPTHVVCLDDTGNDSCGANAKIIGQSGGTSSNTSQSTTTSNTTTTTQTTTSNSTTNTTTTNTTTTQSSSSSTTTTTAVNCVELTIDAPEDATTQPTPPGTTYAITAEWTCAGLNTNLRVGIFDGSNTLISNIANQNSANYNQDAGTCTYTFNVTSPGSLANGTYYVKQMTNGTTGTRVDSPVACLKPIIVQSTAVPDPAMVITKSATMTAGPSAGSIYINYSLVARNIGTVPAYVTTIRDDLPPEIDGSNTTQVSNINPSTGVTRTSGYLEWAVNATFAVAEQRTYSYRVFLTAAQAASYGGDCLRNVVDLNYGPDTTPGNPSDDSQYQFENYVCLPTTGGTPLPSTGLFDEGGLPLWIGLFLILGGILVNRYPYLMNTLGYNVEDNAAMRAGNRLSESLSNTSFRIRQLFFGRTELGFKERLMRSQEKKVKQKKD